MILTAKDILDQVECKTDVKLDLKSAFARQANDPRKLYKAFESIIDGAHLRWPWLEKYPDTFDSTSVYPKDLTKAFCQLLVNSMLHADSIARRFNQWEAMNPRKPYLIIHAVSDNADFDECANADKKVISVNTTGVQDFLPLHRPGCRCFLNAANEIQLNRWYPDGWKVEP